LTDFQPIDTVIKEHLKNVTGIVVKESDLKAGTNDKGDWTMKIFTLEDPTGQLELACFGNTQISKLEKGFTYEIENIWWREKEEKWSASLGDYAKVRKLEAAATTPPERTDTSKIPPTEPEPTTKLPKPSLVIVDFVNQENMLLLQIEAIITLQHKALGIPLNGQQIGMHTREIYLQSKKTNLTKASNIK